MNCTPDLQATFEEVHTHLRNSRELTEGLLTMSEDWTAVGLVRIGFDGLEDDVNDFGMRHKLVPGFRPDDPGPRRGCEDEDLVNALVYLRQAGDAMQRLVTATGEQTAWKFLRAEFKNLMRCIDDFGKYQLGMSFYRY